MEYNNLNQNSKNDLKFSVGYNYDLDGFLSLISRYKKNIDSVYFPIPNIYLGSCRVGPQKNAKEYIKEIFKILEKCKELEIDSIMLLNSTVVDYSKIYRILSILRFLKRKNLLNRVCVADPYLLKEIKKNIPEMIFEISIVAHVRTLEEAKFFKEIGADIITVDREIIRNIALIKNMCKISKIKVLLNEGCLKDCVYRYAHYNFLSSCSFNDKKNNISSDQKNKVDKMCTDIISKHPHKIFSAPFVRPEDLKEYLGFGLKFKLSTRNWTTDVIEQCLVSYSNMGHKGNLISILNSNTSDIFEYIDNSKLEGINFFEKLSNCGDNCEICDFCNKLLKEAVIIKGEYKR